MRFSSAALLAVLSATSSLAQDVTLDTTLVSVPTLTSDLPVTVSTELPVTVSTDLPVTISTDLPVTLPSVSASLPIDLLSSTTNGVATTTPTVTSLTTVSLTSSSVGPSSTGSFVNSGLAGGSNTASGSGSSSTPIPDPNGSAGIRPISTGGNSTSGFGIGAGSNNINGTSGSNSTLGPANNGGANTGATNGIAPSQVPSMSPASLYTAIITSQVSLSTILSVITSLSAPQINAIQNAVTAQQASLQTCYAPTVCLTNPSNPGQLAGGTLVVSTLNGQSTTFQIPAGAGNSGSANYITTSSGPGTLANAAAALQSMGSLPASSDATRIKNFAGVGAMTALIALSFL